MYLLFRHGEVKKKSFGVDVNYLNELAADIHKASKRQGYWDKPRQTGTLLMLCVSELGEALEADRTNKFANMKGFKTMVWDEEVESRNYDLNFMQSFEYCIKDSFEDEMIDTLTRLLDLCAFYQIDIPEFLRLKLRYNKLRSYCNGKEY